MVSVRTVTLGALLVLAWIGLMIEAGASLPVGVADAKCQPGRTNDYLTYRWDGWLNTPGATVGGVYTDMNNYSPWVQPGSNVSAWSMLSTTDRTRWAQVGWWEYAYGSRQTFVQWTDSSGSVHTKTWSPQSTGAYTYYTTLFDASSHVFTFQVAGSTVDTESASWTPNEASIMGETHSLADQMPGGAYAGESFTDSHMYTFGWGNFGIGASDFNSNSTYFGIGDVSQLQRNIWDRACAL